MRSHNAARRRTGRTADYLNESSPRRAMTQSTYDRARLVRPEELTVQQVARHT